MCSVAQFISALQKLPRQEEEINIVLKQNKVIRSLLSQRKVVKNRRRVQYVNRTVSTILTVKQVPLPKHIKARFQACIINVDNFWTTNEQSGLSPSQLHSQADTFSRYFQAALNCAEDQTWNAIMLRFLMLFFHDVKLLHNVRHLRDLVPQAISRLRTLTGFSEDELQSQFQKWCHGAAIYHALARRLGIGVLFFLPERISKWMWEKELSITGPCFERVIEHLGEVGLLNEPEKHDADTLGERLKNMMVEPFRFLEHEAAMPAVTTTTDQINNLDQASLLPAPLDVVGRSRSGVCGNYSQLSHIEHLGQISSNSYSGLDMLMQAASNAPRQTVSEPVSATSSTATAYGKMNTPDFNLFDCAQDYQSADFDFNPVLQDFDFNPILQDFDVESQLTS